MINVALIGFGGICQAVHYPAYLELEKQGLVKLIAICDVEESRFSQKMEINIGGSDAVISDDVKKYMSLLKHAKLKILSRFFIIQCLIGMRKAIPKILKNT